MGILGLASGQGLFLFATSIPKLMAVWSFAEQFQFELALPRNSESWLEVGFVGT